MSPRQIKNVSYDFSGQVVLITGAARGQGRSHALAFAQAGADVVISDICAQIDSIEYPMATSEDLKGVAAMVEALGVRCLARECDVRDPEQVGALVDAAISTFGRIDVLINNAGIDTVLYIADLGVQAWDDMVNTNLRAAYLTSQAVSRAMIEQGRGKIVMIGSVNSFIGLPGHAHYVAAKHGLLGLTRALALEFAQHKINVNIVCPGAINTPMTRMAEGHDDWMAEIGHLVGPWNVINEKDQLLDPEEITNAVLWLSSDASDFVTGTSLMVDAGTTIK
jgi:SDR family mycofactocin-dependent oxidoreductase